MSRKGSAEMLPRHQSKACYQRGRCTIYPRAHRICLVVMRAVPWSLKAKNREKARARFYLPVCLHLTQRGQAQKAWWSRAERIEVLNLSPFSFLFRKAAVLLKVEYCWIKPSGGCDAHHFFLLPGKKFSNIGKHTHLGGVYKAMPYILPFIC